MILLWGLRRDAPLARVEAELVDLGVPFALVDQRQILEYGIQVDVGRPGEGLLRLGEVDIDLSSVTAAYVRPYDTWKITAVSRAGRESAEWRHAVAFDDALWLWTELTDAFVVNRPSAMSSNNSKPYQALAIEAHGFEVPDTLLTTNVAAAREFCAEHGAVIYKSISGTRSVVTKVGELDETRAPDLAWCPTQFQAHVPGLDYRVHVIGDDVFCSQITSAADDYRYAARDGHDISMSPFEMPDDWARRCRELSASLNFAVAGIDLRRTPDGRWFCFEVNPSPAFSFYDRHGQGMARAVATLLARGNRNTETDVRPTARGGTTCASHHD